MKGNEQVCTVLNPFCTSPIAIQNETVLHHILLCQTLSNSCGDTISPRLWWGAAHRAMQDHMSLEFGENLTTDYPKCCQRNLSVESLIALSPHQAFSMDSSVPPPSHIFLLHSIKSERGDPVWCSCGFSPPSRAMTQ